MQHKKDPAFCKAIEFVLHSEGGYADLPGDPGGPTMYGIAFNYNVSALALLGINRDNMKTLTLDQAREIYYIKYWCGSGANGITDEGLAYLHLDTAVNCGVGAAHSMMRKLSADPKHFNGQGDNNEALFLRLCMEYEILRLDYYTKCKNRKTFLEGWINRMEFVMNKVRELV